MGEGRLEVKGYSSGDWYRRIFANRSVRSMAQTVNGDTVGSFDLGQEPVEEGTGEIRKWDGARHVDGGIQRELGTLDKIEDDRVFKTYQGVANITQVKGCFWIEQIESHAIPGVNRDKCDQNKAKTSRMATTGQKIAG